jgi:iron complex outermembrane receptor protein
MVPRFQAPPGGRWSFAVFGENLTDKGYCLYVTQQPSDSLFAVRNPATDGTLTRCFPGAPRTFAGSVTVKF